MSATGDLLLAAASQANAAVTHLIEAAKDAENVAADLRAAEVPELLCDALKMTLEIIGASYGRADENEMASQLLGACTRFLEGWA